MPRAPTSRFTRTRNIRTDDEFEAAIDERIQKHRARQSVLQAAGGMSRLILEVQVDDRITGQRQRDQEPGDRRGRGDRGDRASLNAEQVSRWIELDSNSTLAVLDRLSAGETP